MIVVELVNRFWGSILKDKEKDGLSIGDFVELSRGLGEQELKAIRAITAVLPSVSPDSLGRDEAAPLSPPKRRVQK